MFLQPCVSRYQIGLPWIDKKTMGSYVMSMTDNNGESASQTVEIVLAQG